MKNTTSTKLSHGFGNDNRNQNQSMIHAYFENLAQLALDKSLARAADLSYFKQVKRRIEEGEDFSRELPQLKKMDKKTAVACIKTLMKRCDADFTSYWAMPQSAKVKTKLEHQSYKGELVPRFRATYTFKTAQGAINFLVLTQGRYIFVSANTEGVKKANIELALREVEQQITLATLIA